MSGNLGGRQCRRRDNTTVCRLESDQSVGDKQRCSKRVSAIQLNESVLVCKLKDATVASMHWH